MNKERENNLKFKKVIVLVLLVTTVFVTLNKYTHAYYNVETEWTPIFNSKVGDFASDGEKVKTGPIEKHTDVNVIFYTETPNSENRYVESKGIPVTNYVVNKELSNCYSKDKEEGTTYNSYTINSEGLIDIEVEENKPNQIVCRIYYDYENNNNLDVIVYAYLQDINGTRKYNGNNYKIINTIPDNVTFIDFTCNNKEIETNIKYENNTLDIESIGPNICKAYFK